jgi:RNA polymerase sigma-70 factor (ECF subfamily)
MKNYNKIYIDKEKRKERDEFNYLFKKLTARIYIQLYQSFSPQKDDKVSLQENAQNIAQDTVMAYLKKIEEGDIIQNREAWCTTVAKNRTIDFFRKKKPERISNYENSDDEENESKNFNKIEAIYEDKKNQDKSFYDILDDECIEKLNKNHKKTLLRIMQGEKTREIAEVLSIPQNTILTWATHAKRQYSECMGFS